MSGHGRLHQRASDWPSSSSSSFNTDDDDAITPCPVESSMPRHHQMPADASTRRQEASPARPQVVRRSSSWRMLNGTGTEDDIDLNTLWHRMLAIQRVFGCYNSARMRAALDSGVEDEFVPSRTCLDLLNDSIDQLPDESKRQLEEFLEQTSCHAPSKRRSWRQRLLHKPIFG